MSTDTIKQTYRDVEIVYIEREDKWNFTVNGRERNLESLAKAKESIDRSLDYERKEKPWKPFAAYYHRSTSEGFTKVTVTSEADYRYGSGKYYWITADNGRKKERSKESELFLYAVTPENERRIAKWQELDEQIDRFSKQQKDLVESMDRAQPPTSTT